MKSYNNLENPIFPQKKVMNDVMIEAVIVIVLAGAVIVSMAPAQVLVNSQEQEGVQNPSVRLMTRFCY